MLGKRISKKTLLIELAEVKSKLAELEFQQKIRDQEDNELYFRIFNKQKAIILLIDPGSGLIIDASSSAAEFYGYDLTAIKTLNIEDLNILSLKEIVNEINQAKSQNRNYFYFKHKLASGTIRDVEVRSVTVKIRGRKLLYFIVFDITDRLNLESKLKESEKDFQILSENIKEVFWFKTNDNISYVSSGYENIWGKTPDSLYLNPNSFAECVYKKDKERILKVFNSEKYKTEGYFNEEYRIVRPDGSVKWIRMKTFTIEKKGVKTRSVGIAEDITDWKNAEEELIKTKEGYALSDDLDTIEQNARQLIVLNEKLAASEKLLKELNSNKDRFFSIISHDLRNPFMGILGYSKMLAEESLGSEETLEISSKLYETSKNTYSLLENLLEWSLAQRNKIEFNPEIFSINEAVTEIFLLFKEKALKKNISLINKIGGDSFAYADFNMIKTVLRNLISNAIKFCKENGEISIEESYENDKIRLSVCDNGIGIKNEDLAKLFRIDGRFTQEGTAGEKGTGLGLILSKEFVEKNSGLIWMESEFNKGTKIHFQLPVSPPEKPGLRNIILQK